MTQTEVAMLSRVIGQTVREYVEKKHAEVAAQVARLDGLIVLYESRVKELEERGTLARAPRWAGEYEAGHSYAKGEVVRRRLSWFSPVTDNALFVNQRGQRIGEQSLDSLARQMAAGRVRIVTEEKSRLVDRAWNAVMGALGHLVGNNAHTEAHA